MTDYISNVLDVIIQPQETGVADEDANTKFKNDNMAWRIEARLRIKSPDETTRDDEDDE